MVCLVTVIVRCAVAYALVDRCLRETPPENRPAVLRGTAEVLRSLRYSRRSQRGQRRDSADRAADTTETLPPGDPPRLIGAESAADEPPVYPFHPRPELNQAGASARCAPSLPATRYRPPSSTLDAPPASAVTEADRSPPPCARSVATDRQRRLQRTPSDTADHDHWTVDGCEVARDHDQRRQNDQSSRSECQISYNMKVGLGRG